MTAGLVLTLSRLDPPPRPLINIVTHSVAPASSKFCVSNPAIYSGGEQLVNISVDNTSL